MSITTLLLATSQSIVHPAPFLQHFQLGELTTTLRISFLLEGAVTLSNGTGTDSNTKVVEKLGKGTLWRMSRALLTGTTLRILEQAIIVAIGSQMFSDILLEDAAEVSRDTEKLRTNSSEVVARVESSVSALSSGIRTTMLYHISVAFVGMGEYYLNSCLRWQKRKNLVLSRKKANKDSAERNQWHRYLWSMCGWSIVTTGVGAGIGTFIAPGVGSALGKLVGMNIIYLTATEPNTVD